MRRFCPLVQRLFCPFEAKVAQRTKKPLHQRTKPPYMPPLPRFYITINAINRADLRPNRHLGLAALCPWPLRGGKGRLLVPLLPCIAAHGAFPCVLLPMALPKLISGARNGDARRQCHGKIDFTHFLPLIWSHRGQYGCSFGLVGAKCAQKRGICGLVKQR
jgi:hypothetical protein